MKDDEPMKMHLLFSRYLAHKIRCGFFQKGSQLPSGAAFMSLFKLSFLDIAKAVLELESLGLIKIINNSEVVVVVGRHEEKNNEWDVKSDIIAILEEFDEYENKALDEAWNRIPAKAVSIATDDIVHSAAERIWQTAREIHGQIIGNCGDMETCMRLEATYSKLEFFMRIYIDSLSREDCARHISTLDELVHGFATGDKGAAHFHLRAHIAQMREKLLEIFKSADAIPCNKERQGSNWKHFEARESINSNKEER